MSVLVACEESGRVRDALIAAGIDAVSCDLEPSATPGPHILGDVLDVLDGGWTGMVAHPPCTYLTSTANRWLYHQPAKPKPGVLYLEERRAAVSDAVDFVRQLADAPIPRIAIENPIGMLTSRWRAADQYVQPWQHGDPYRKATGLWLKGLPPLQPTDVLPPVDPVTGLSNRQAFSWLVPPGPDRAKIRSRTYPGIARAIAAQWGALLAGAS